MNERFYGVLKIFLLNKMALLLISILAVVFLPIGDGYKINTLSTLNPWAQWDGEAYLTIAEKGYVTLADGRSLYNFLPLYPFAIRLAGFFVQDLALAAVILSNLFSFIAAYYLFRLTEYEFGKSIARKAVVLLLFFPTAFFFSAVYTESMFLAFATASFYYARKGEWTKACILSWFLPFIRIVGLLFWIVLVVERLSQKKRLGITKGDLVLSIAITGVVVFFAFSYFTTGSVFGYANQQNLWTRSISSPHVALANALELILFRGPILVAYSIWNLSVLTFFVLTLYYAFRHMTKSYGMYMFLMMTLPLLSSTLEGFSRFILICFPSFMILAKFLDAKNKFYLPLLVLSASLLIILTARFVTGAVGTVFG